MGGGSSQPPPPPSTTTTTTAVAPQLVRPVPSTTRPNAQLAILQQASGAAYGGVVLPSKGVQHSLSSRGGGGGEGAGALPTYRSLPLGGAAASSREEKRFLVKGGGKAVVRGVYE